MKNKKKTNGTMIKVSDETWMYLNKRKKRGESFDKLIQRMMLEFPEVKE